jgi:3-phosphoshikimate 1-carboxyvinyltransferase
MTTRLMACFGQAEPGRPSEQSLRVEHTRRYRAQGASFAIEPDATAASYFLALPLVAGDRST